MAPESFVLKHFYYGQNIVDGKTTSMGILARSDSLTTEQITRAVRTALVPPIPKELRPAFLCLSGEGNQG